MSVARLREITGVGSAEYEVDGTAYWTDDQLEEVLARHTFTVDAVDVIDYDSAAADVLEAWAARAALNFDVTMDGQSLKRSQISDKLAARAAQFRSEAAGRDEITTVELQAPL